MQSVTDILIGTQVS